MFLFPFVAFRTCEAVFGLQVESGSKGQGRHQASQLAILIGWYTCYKMTPTSEQTTTNVNRFMSNSYDSY
jgi:hypothetical protein